MPSCYYDTIPNYVTSNIQYLPTGITADLTHVLAPEAARAAPLPPSQGAPPGPAAAKAASDPLSAKISFLRLNVTYHTESMLQFKVVPVSQILIHTESLTYSSMGMGVIEMSPHPDPHCTGEGLRPSAVKVSTLGDRRAGLTLDPPAF